jgi:hypothetical protein
MAEEAAHSDDVVEITQYLRETIRDIDETMAMFSERRARLAGRLAILEAAADRDVAAAAADYERRLADRQPYEGRDADEVITEAHRRFIG